MMLTCVSPPLERVRLDDEPDAGDDVRAAGCPVVDAVDGGGEAGELDGCDDDGFRRLQPSEGGLGGGGELSHHRPRARGAINARQVLVVNATPRTVRGVADGL